MSHCSDFQCPLVEPIIEKHIYNCETIEEGIEERVDVSGRKEKNEMRQFRKQKRKKNQKIKANGHINVRHDYVFIKSKNNPCYVFARIVF